MIKQSAHFKWNKVFRLSRRLGAQVWLGSFFSQKEIEMRISSYTSTAFRPSTADFLFASQEIPNFTVCKKQILLVEDNPLLQHIHALWLEQLNYGVTVVSSGEAALAEKISDYQAILMDLDLPGDDGITTTQKLFKRTPQLNIPVIACTSHPEVDMKNACISAGMVGYLQKPISSAQLAHSLKTVLA